MTATRRAVWGVLAAIAAIAVPTWLGAGPAVAQGEDDASGTGSETLTWSVKPTPSEEQPDRPNFVVDVDAGATITDGVRVRNFGDAPLSLAIYASDALTTQSGAPDLLPAGEPPTDVGAWIRLDAARVHVPPGEAVDVGFALAVPADAEPGDHVGGIVTSVATTSVGDDGERVRLDRRLGNLVYVRVSGELRPELTASDLSVGYSGTVNPAGTGSTTVSYTVTNTGNVRLGAEQTVAVDGLLGLGSREAVLEPMGELLPGSSRTFTVEMPDVWPTIRTRASVELVPVPTRDGDTFDDATPAATASRSTWAVPWTLLALLAAAVGGPLLVRWRRRRRRRREARLVQEAVRDALTQRGTTERGAGTPTGSLAEHH